MGLKIRLARGGSKKRPFYRIVVADERAPRDGRYIERVGSYNPMIEKNNSERVILSSDRIKYWLSEGAKPTDRVSRFLADNNLIESRKVPNQTKKHLQSEKTKIKLKEKAEKLSSKAADSNTGSQDIGSSN